MRVNGKWYVKPKETFHVPTRTFYQRELIRCKLGDPNPIDAVQGKCAVLLHRDYVRGVCVCVCLCLGLCVPVCLCVRARSHRRSPGQVRRAVA